MKKRLMYVFSNQHGSVINIALLILILIFLIGIGLSKMSTTDIQIANNIKQDMTTFYETDAGLDNAGEMIEQNLGCLTGFTDTPTEDDGLPADREIIGGMFYVNNLNFGFNIRKKGKRPGVDPDAEDAGEKVVDFFYPPDLDLDLNLHEYRDVPDTNVTVGGATRFSKGSAIQMAAGYEGLGKGAATGGASIIYEVYAERVGENNTSSTHFMQWVHIIRPSPGCFF
ncbi:MAG: hypothetical protein JRF02_07840 [Deltaproteobacteria bacterium]|jgi:hypothetical protein|nr:hypothetical protein [Deltaproteobacteria bacterium]